MTSNSFVIRGKSGHLIVPILAIPTLVILAFGYYREHLPEFCLENAEKVMGVAGLFTLLLILAAMFLKNRRVEVQGDRLRYRSWWSDRTIQSHTVTAVSFETETTEDDDGSHTEHYLSLWREKEPVLRFNTRLWASSDLIQVLNWLKKNNPAIRLDLAVERYLARTPPAP